MTEVCICAYEYFWQDSAYILTIQCLIEDHTVYVGYCMEIEHILFRATSMQLLHRVWRTLGKPC